MLNLVLPLFRRTPESSTNMRPKETAVALSASHNVLELDSSLLKAEHILVLSPRTGVRRNDERFEQAS